MVDDLKAWENDRPADAPNLVLVSAGDAASNRSQGFRSTVLLDSGFNVGRAYGASGTPSAVLVDESGNAISGLGVGAPDVLSILRGGAPAPAEAPSDNGAAALGAAAPAVELPDLDGNTVRLADFAGQPTAVLFWNPGCGFCQRMVDDIKAWEGDKPADAPNLLIVSTGDAAANRAHGFRSPIVLDANFSTGRAFGASGTPSAVLVDANGNVGSQLAVGAPGVLGLLRNDGGMAVDAGAPAVPSVARLTAKQIGAVGTILVAAGFADLGSRADLAGIPRAVWGRMP